MNPQILGTRSGALLLLSLSCLASAPLLADTLYLDTAAIVGCAPITVSMGSAQIMCTTSAYNGITPITYAGGNLSTGIFGSSSEVITNNGVGGGASDSSFVQVTYIFTEIGVQSGSIRFNLSVPGTLTPNLPGVSDADAVLGYLSSEQVVVNGTPAPVGDTSLSSGTNTVTITIPISDGTAELQFSLFTGAAATCLNASCMSDADFFDPTSITGASVYDANGNLVTDASLISESGFNPNAVVPASIIPEPSSLFMLCTGLAGFAAAIRARTIS